MAEVTAAMVKALRERTGQGMMACKEALMEADGDAEAAIAILRRKGLAAAAKKSQRTATEGLIAIADAQGGAAMVEVVCETDFCARNEVFRTMVRRVAELAAAAPAGEVEATEEIKETVQACFNQIGENMRFSRGVKICAPTVGRYLHHNGKVGVLVGIEGDIDPQALEELCMHIAFADPMAVRPEDIPADIVERERQLAAEEAAGLGKPPQIVEKIVEGKVRKFLAANALMEQLIDGDKNKPVRKLLGSAKITTFARFGIGQ